MNDDLAIEWTKTFDESTPRRDNTYARTKTYVFWIGKHGPFTERVPLDNFDETEIVRRVEKLRAHLRTLPT